MSESVESAHDAIAGSSRAWKQPSETLSQAAPAQEQHQTNVRDATKHKIPSTAASGGPDNTSPISSLSNDCLKFYQNLHDVLSKSTDERATEAGFNRDKSLTEIIDSLSRFKAWGGNIAAFQKGHLKSSLDARLQEAKEIRGRILRILRDLKQSLETASLIVSGSIPNERWQLGALSDSDDDEVADAGEAGPETSELEELFTAIKAANGSLLKLSLVIRTSPTRDDYLKAASRYSLDSVWDIGHVREKYGSAKRSADWLVERMGKATTRRRQYLKYREEHHGKLSRDWEEVPKDPSPDEQKTIALTKATTFVEAKVLIEKDESDGKGSFGSQTSYEPTVVGEDVHKLTPPAPPKFAFEGIPFEFGEPFRCPYCYTEQVVKNKKAWKKHVFRDLKPYVCTFKECDLKMFRSRNEWWLHELHNHRREWICTTCYAPFNSKSTFVGHLKSSHNTTLSGSQLDGLVLKSEEPVNKIPASACMLCAEWEANLLDPKQDAKRAFLNDGAKAEPCGTLNQFRRHLGRHMEQLALFALPMAEGEGMEDDSAGDDDEVASQQSGASELALGDTGEQPDLEMFEAEFLKRFSPVMTYVEMEVILQTITPRPDLVRNVLDVFEDGSTDSLKGLADQLLRVYGAVSQSINADPNTEMRIAQAVPMAADQHVSGSTSFEARSVQGDQVSKAAQAHGKISGLTVFKPSDMQNLPDIFSAEEKQKWERGLQSLWDHLRLNDPQSQDYKDALRKLDEFWTNLNNRLQRSGAGDIDFIRERDRFQEAPKTTTSIFPQDLASMENVLATENNVKTAITPPSAYTDFLTSIQSPTADLSKLKLPFDQSEGNHGGMTKFDATSSEEARVREYRPLTSQQTPGQRLVAPQEVLHGVEHSEDKGKKRLYQLTLSTADSSIPMSMPTNPGLPPPLPPPRYLRETTDSRTDEPGLSWQSGRSHEGYSSDRGGPVHAVTPSMSVYQSFTKTSNEPTAEPVRAQPTAQAGIRACETCRPRKQKCDEQRPTCGLCQRMKLECRYREPEPTNRSSHTPAAPTSALAPDQDGNEISGDAKWTKIKRDIVSVQALDETQYRYEGRPDFVYILGELGKAEIDSLIERSRVIRFDRINNANISTTPSHLGLDKQQVEEEEGTRVLDFSAETEAAKRLAREREAQDEIYEQNLQSLQKELAQEDQRPNDLNAAEQAMLHGLPSWVPDWSLDPTLEAEVATEKDKDEMAELAEMAKKQKEEKEEREKEYQRRLEDDLRKSGMDERQIEVVLKKDKGVDPARPTYTRMSRRHLSIETLNRYRIDYEFDQDPDYVLIKRWVPEYEQDFLWSHTRELRDRRGKSTSRPERTSSMSRRDGGSHPVVEKQDKFKPIPSPPLALQKAEVHKQKCEQCNEEHAVIYYCDVCGVDYCNKCWDLAGPHRSGRVGTDGLPHERTLRHPPSQTTLLRPDISRRPVSYDLERESGGVRIETVNTGRNRQAWYDQTPSSGRYLYEDKLNQAAKYQEDVVGPTIPLTAEVLRQPSFRSNSIFAGPSSMQTDRRFRYSPPDFTQPQALPPNAWNPMAVGQSQVLAPRQRRRAGSSTRPSHSDSRDESDYKRSATTRTTRSGTGDDVDVTIKVTGQARVMVGGAQIDCSDGGAIEIKRPDILSQSSTSEYGDTLIEDRQNRAARTPHLSRASSQPGRSYDRVQPKPPIDDSHF